MIRVIILDFDGVIVESNDIKTQAFAKLFAPYPGHLDTMMAHHEANISVSRVTKIDYFVSVCLERPWDQALRESLAEEFSRLTADLVAECPLVPGAEDLLSVLGKRVPLYVASVTPQADLDAILGRRDLLRHFRRAYGCPPWTKPDAVRDILRREGVVAAEAVLVGDSEGDRRAAEETGVGFAARNSGLAWGEPPPVLHSDLHDVTATLLPLIP